MDLEKVVAHYGANAVEFHRVTNQVESRFVALTQRFAQAAAGGGLIGGILGAGAGIAAVSAITAIEAPLRLVATGIRDVIDLTAKAVGTAIDLSAQWEQSAISFEVMTKSAERGRRLLTDLQQLAIESPYRSSQMVHYGEMLLGYGVQSEDIIPTLARLGDIAGGNIDKFRRLALAFGQVLSAGRFMGQEKRQFAEAGVGLEDFAQTAGMSSRQFVEAMERGEVGADVMVRTINRLTNEGGRFFGLMQRINLETVRGQFDALMERLERFGRFIFAGDTEKGVRGLFQRFGVADFIGGLSSRLDTLDLNKYLDRFEQWARGGLQALSPLEQTFQVLTDRVEKWVSAGEGMVPTWDSVRSVIEDINTKHLPAFLDWVERTAKVAKDMAIELGKAAAFWQQLAATNLPGLPGGPDNKSTPTQDVGDLFRGLGLLGPEEKERILKQYPNSPLAALNRQFLDEQEQKRFEADYIARVKERRAEAAGAKQAEVMRRYMTEPIADTLGQRLAIAKAQSAMNELRGKEQAFAALVGTGGATGLAAPILNTRAMQEQQKWDAFMATYLPAQRNPLAFAGALGAAAPFGAGATYMPSGATTAEGYAALFGGTAFGIGQRRTSILPAPNIGVKYDAALSREQRRLMRSLMLEEGEGNELGAYGRFERRMTDLRKLAGYTDYRGPEFAALGGVAGAMRPHITQEQYRRGIFNAYEDLEKAFGKQVTPQLAPAALAGTGAAQEIINRALVGPTNALDRALALLDAARAEAAANKEYLSKILPVLEAIRDNPIQVVEEDY